jgi:small subunit ribosomal protein S6
MSLYETVYIARQDLTTGQVDALTEQFSEIITSNGGSIAKKEYWGLKSLAYRIKKNRKGHYVLMNIDAPSAAVQEMERLMRLNEDILRFLTLSVEAHEEGPSIQMRQGPKEERTFSRDDRGPREDRGSRRPYVKHSRPQYDQPKADVVEETN